MRANVSAKRSLIKRCLSVATMLGMYCLAMIAITGFAISTSTDALAKNGRGGGRGGGRGRGRGGWRGGIWFPWIGPGICHHPWTSARVWCNY